MDGCHNTTDRLGCHISSAADTPQTYVTVVRRTVYQYIVKVSINRFIGLLRLEIDLPTLVGSSG